MEVVFSLLMRMVLRARINLDGSCQPSLNFTVSKMHKNKFPFLGSRINVLLNSIGGRGKPALRNLELDHAP
ncbi:UNVERIFIED_CONTAM: hypothetical protein RMT77_015504 [Armadillidium vulgare]